MFMSIESDSSTSCRFSYCVIMLQPKSIDCHRKLKSEWISFCPYHWAACVSQVVLVLTTIQIKWLIAWFINWSIFPTTFGRNLHFSFSPWWVISNRLVRKLSCLILFFIFWIIKKINSLVDSAFFMRLIAERWVQINLSLYLCSLAFPTSGSI